MAFNPRTPIHLYRMDLPDHACPWGLKALRLLQERGLSVVDHTLRGEDAVAQFKAAHGVATTPQIFVGEERIGGYNELAARLGVRAERPEVSYTPVVVVFGTAAVLSLVLAAGPTGFMGLALSLLAMLKLMDVDAFATSFRKYDLLSQHWRRWAQLYPGIELLVGLGVLMPQRALVATGFVGATAIALGLMGLVSVGKAVFIDRLALNCACVGGNTKTPLGLVSLAENLIMTLMGIWMVLG
jgi:glutaredoxin